MTVLKPRMSVPALDVATLDGERWNIADQQPENFTMVVFYRGYHCPICKMYLRDLDGKLEKFRELGVETIAISSDTKERAAQSQQEWGLNNLRVGYGLPIEHARTWGLYVSHAIKDSEPAEFSEPGLFLVRPDGTLYAAAVQTMPFARPEFGALLQAVQMVTKSDYPARGEA